MYWVVLVAVPDHPDCHTGCGGAAFPPEEPGDVWLLFKPLPSECLVVLQDHTFFIFKKEKLPRFDVLCRREVYRGNENITTCRVLEGTIVTYGYRQKFDEKSFPFVRFRIPSGKCA